MKVKNKCPKTLRSCGLGSTAQHRPGCRTAALSRDRCQASQPLVYSFNQELCPKGFWLAIWGLGLPGQAMGREGQDSSSG